MNLTNSILTSAAIVAAIWLLVVYQPVSVNQAIAAPADSSDWTTEAASEADVPAASPTPSKAVQHIAQAPQTSAPLASTSEQTAATSQSGAIAIRGVSNTMALTEVDQLWTDFIPLLEKTSQRPERIFVYYRNFDSAYSQARITIGVRQQLLQTNGTSVEIPAFKRYQTLLARQDRSTTELAAGWDKIDYNRTVKSVLEIHYLDAAYNPSSSQLFVEYQ